MQARMIAALFLLLTALDEVVSLLDGVSGSPPGCC